jgi:hypothetical protein
MSARCRIAAGEAMHETSRGSRLFLTAYITEDRRLTKSSHGQTHLESAVAFGTLDARYD